MFLGLDLGTSGLRGLLVDASGTPVTEASGEYSVSNPHDGWSEQDPSEWIAACQTVLADLQSKSPDAFSKIIGIGISGHMHGAVTLDKEFQTVRPCILWNDTRSAKEAAELDENPAFREFSGNIVFPGFTAPKLAWMANHEPELFERVAHVMLSKDYLVHWLTDVLATDMSDASGTSWLDVGNRNWSEELVSASGMSVGQLPTLFEGSQLVGTLKEELAAKFNLSSTVGIVAGGADNACAACGIGAFEEGQGFVSLGTSGVVLVARERYAPEPTSAVHTFCHAVPEKWYQMGVTLSATDSLEWLADILGSDPVALSNSLPVEATGPTSVMFLPYLSGERTPHNDADIRGAFIGLSKTSDNAVLTRSVMEGVSFSLRDCLDALRSTGCNPPALIAVGGGSKSDFWLSTLANTLGLPIQIPEKGDFGAALGAARLAMVGAGKLPASDVMTLPKIERVIEPDPSLIPLYESAFQKYKKLYRALKDVS
ncbi:MAG: xylulokinase [Roseovarius sp.]|nr:xylulokinase [Roseovarius sp.]